MAALAWMGIAIGSAYCQPSQEATDTGEVTESSDVPVAQHTSGAGDTVIISGPPAIRIGLLDGAAEYIFGDVRDVAALTDGSIVVVDGQGRVAVFASSGAWLRDIGGVGSGPGEYRTPRSVIITRDTITVWDIGLRRMSTYTTDGVFVGSTTLRDKKALGLPVRRLTNGLVDAQESGQLQDAAPAQGVLVRLGAKGRVLDTLVGPFKVPEYGWRIIDETSETGQMVEPPALSLYPAWTTDGDLLAVAHPEESLIELFDVNGGVRHQVLLHRRIGPPTEEQRENYFELVQEAFGFDDVTMAQVRRATEFVEVLAPIADMLFDEKGIYGWLKSGAIAGMESVPPGMW